MKKLFKIAIQMDPWSKIKPKTDSTFIIALEAQQRGHQLYSYVPENLSLENGIVTAVANKFSLHPHKKKFFTLQKEEKIKLDSFDIVLVRQDPPFNMNYITATYILEKLPKATLVLNNPKHIRDYPEKLSMFSFKKIIPPTLISSTLNDILSFHKKNKFSIIKPLYGNGGEGIEKIDSNISRSKKLIRRLLIKYKLPIVVQKFIKEISLGDRRIVLLDGDYTGSIARIPAKNSIKANLHAGGTAKKTGLVFRDKKICKLLKPFLKKNNLFFAGIDVIGNYLTEINVTSPTGIQEINKLNNIKIEKIFWDKIQRKLS
jgi:glutathione synthase